MRQPSNFDFVNPVWPGRRDFRQGRGHRLNEGIFTQHAADVGVFAGLGKCAINSEKPRLGSPDIAAPRPGGARVPGMAHS